MLCLKGWGWSKLRMRQAMVYVQVLSKEQEKDGFSIRAQLKPLRDYALETEV